MGPPFLKRNRSQVLSSPLKITSRGFRVSGYVLCVARYVLQVSGASAWIAYASHN
jgi:hypothetical protein